MFKCLIIIISLLGIVYGWNPSPVATQQHTQLNSIIFQDTELRALADSLNLNWQTLCEEFNEPQNSGPGTGFSSFETWDSFKNNWSTKSDISQALKDLLHYIEDSSVPANHTPGGNKFQDKDPSLPSYSSYARHAENIIEFSDAVSYLFLNAIYGAFITKRKPWFIKNEHESSGSFPSYNEDIYEALSDRHKTNNYISFYNNLLALHKQSVENQASSYKAHVEDRDGIYYDPTHWIEIGYSQAISVGREIIYIYLYCTLHPEAWDDPPSRKIDISPIVNLLLD